MPIYYGVSGKARKVIGGYYGVNGKSELIIGNNEVPSGYRQYKYIFKTNNNSYIRISTTINTYTQIICNFAVQNYETNKPNGDIFYSSGYYARMSSGYLYIYKGSSSYRHPDLTVKKDHVINLTKNTNGDCYFDNNKIFTNIETFSNNSYIEILDSGSARTIYISGLELYDLNTQKSLLRLIPCVKIDDSIAGFYDTVNKQFYKNSSSQNDYSIQCTNEL